MHETERVLAERASAWTEAVAVRRSRRRYSARPSEAQLAALRETSERFRPYPEARTVVIEMAPEELFTGFVGSYGRVVGATSAMLFVGDRSSYACDLHLGYTGEALVLEATALGIDTCWVGGFFDRRLAPTLTELGDTEQVLAVTPLGRASDDLSSTERAMRGMASSDRRKPIDEIAPGIGATWPLWARRGVELARLAPSAINRQPWRFSVRDGDLVLRAAGVRTPGVTRELDCGIAMLHAHLGALAEGIDGAWVDLQHDGIARFEPKERL